MFEFDVQSLALPAGSAVGQCGVKWRPLVILRQSHVRMNSREVRTKEMFGRRLQKMMEILLPDGHESVMDVRGQQHLSQLLLAPECNPSIRLDLVFCFFCRRSMALGETRATPSGSATQLDNLIPQLLFVFLVDRNEGPLRRPDERRQLFGGAGSRRSGRREDSRRTGSQRARTVEPAPSRSGPATTRPAHLHHPATLLPGGMSSDHNP